MNPEFQRNLWLELTPRRMLLMAVLLALGFFAAALPGADSGPAEVARWLYYAIVVVWGTRNASFAVLGEIRDRTWDAQRLSSLGAGSMTWGKLFGSTAYNWFGGILCLGVLLAHIVTREGVTAAVMQGVMLITMGVLAQAAALLASLVGVRRKKSYGRLDISLYQGAGLLAALAVFYIWDSADVMARLQPGALRDEIIWWSVALPEKAFLLVSLAIFAGWTFLGCYRLMRLELKVHNGPLVWALFLLFMGVYAAGFDAWLQGSEIVATDAEGPIRLGLASFVFLMLAYGMVFLEPKDNVHYRWMLAQARKGALKNFVSGLHGWMMSYAAAIAGGLLLIVWLSQVSVDPRSAPLVAAVMGFMTRDIGIVLLMSMRAKGKGDFASLALLGALYFLAPMIVEPFGLTYLFLPTEKAPLMSAVAAWVEAAAIVFLASSKLFRMKDAK